MSLNAVQARDLAREIGEYVEAAPSGVFVYSVKAILEAVVDDGTAIFRVRLRGRISTMGGAVFQINYNFYDFERWRTLRHELLEAKVIGIPKEKTE
jgi:hypothetical protein